jgi:peptidoglycan/LPS O-acetylase OafA/YrhL
MQANNKLLFLDGYRGFLALTVFIDHFFWVYVYVPKGVDKFGEYIILRGTSMNVGVPGFFVLSAFLLTYRLLIDFERAHKNKMLLLQIAKYFIRRFFRIYLVFAIFWTMLCIDMNFGANLIRGYKQNNYNDYLSGLFLFSNGNGHLWTIPCEIRYYFFIPIICIIIAKSGKHWFVLWLLISLSIYFNQKINPFQFNGYDYHHWNGYKLWPRFTIFLMGTQLGILYFNFLKIPNLLKCFNNSYFKHFMSILLIPLFILQFRYFSTAYGRPSQFQGALYQTIMIFVMLFAQAQGPISTLFNSWLLQTCGKYSFGIYLFHPMVIEIFIRLRQFYSLTFRFQFESIFVIFFTTYLVGMIWFFILENFLIKLANKICKKIQNHNFFHDTQVV